MFNKVPKKYHPPGFQFLYEDHDIIVGIKAAGLLTVAAKWNRDITAESMLNIYVRKGAAKSPKHVYVVHRLDQATSGVLVFAKNEAAFHFLKAHWPTTVKTYLAIVHRPLKEKTGKVSSFLSQDEDYVVHSSASAAGAVEAAGLAADDLESGTTEAKLSHTEYTVLKETAKFSLLKINLLTGRKNQIRVHMAELGHPVVGDMKYGPNEVKNRDLMLHSYKLEITHPFNKKRLTFEAKPPRYFQALIEFDY
jgi:RluA family pseudouridine synthase